jgi:hypothetical protein
MILAGALPTLYFIPESPLLKEGEDASACAALPVSRKLLALEHNVTQSATWQSVARHGDTDIPIERVGNAAKLQLQDSWNVQVSMDMRHGGRIS